ncbi:MAG: heterodisulfide reductase-related iron-sulfur binding cluster, partial [bacterium]|nr:heterodisulfide reductase-related iron-sulfur binding cluster [bacterium]
AHLVYDKPVEVRHPLDILVNSIGIKKIAEQSSYLFEGLKIAPYYGCQIVRPVYHFDDLDDPTTMDDLLRGLGGDVVNYPCKVRCCGGMLMTTFEDVALDLNHRLLSAAEENGADVIVTLCPLCQMNLEAYQSKINERFGAKHHLPIVYFTQLVGLALGIEPKKLGLDSLLIPLTNPKLKAKKAVEAAA